MNQINNLVPKKNERNLAHNHAPLRRELSGISKDDITFLQQHKKSRIPVVLQKFNRFVNVDIKHAQENIFGSGTKYWILVVIILTIIAISIETYFTVTKLKTHRKKQKILDVALAYVSTPKVLRQVIPTINISNSMWWKYHTKLLSSRYIHSSPNYSQVQMIFSVATANFAISKLVQRMKICSTIVNINGTKQWKIHVVQQPTIFTSYWYIPTFSIQIIKPLSYTPTLGLVSWAAYNQLAYSYLNLDLDTYPNNSFPQKKEDFGRLIKTNQSFNFYTLAVSHDKIKNTHTSSDKNILLSSTDYLGKNTFYNFIMTLLIIASSTPHNNNLNSTNLNAVPPNTKSSNVRDDNNSLTHSLYYSFEKFWNTYATFNNIATFTARENVSIENFQLQNGSASWLNTTRFIVTDLKHEVITL